MKLLIVSDTHGDLRALRRVVDKEQDAAAVIFLGDGLRDAETLQDERPALRLYTVSGNCDRCLDLSVRAGDLAPFGGVLFFYTHGHLYGVKTGLTELAEAAAVRGAQVALFGHTHRQTLERRNGVILFNPGALSSVQGEGHYGIAMVQDGKVTLEHRKL